MVCVSVVIGFQLMVMSRPKTFCHFLREYCPRQHRRWYYSAIFNSFFLDLWKYNDVLLRWSFGRHFLYFYIPLFTLPTKYCKCSFKFNLNSIFRLNGTDKNIQFIVFQYKQLLLTKISTTASLKMTSTMIHLLLTLLLNIYKKYLEEVNI